MPITPAVSSPTPGLPADDMESTGDQDLTQIFTLYYRKGGDMLSLHFHLARKDFNSRDHFRAAIERGKLHCERMRYRFLFCRPYITSLEVEEERMAI